MGYMMGQMWVLLAISAIVGVLTGWWVWGREATTDDKALKTARDELAEARRQVEVLEMANGQLKKSQGSVPSKDIDAYKTRIAELEGQLMALKAGVAPVASNVVPLSSAKAAKPAEAAKPSMAVVAAKPAAKPEAKAAPAKAPASKTPAKSEAKPAEVKPAAKPAAKAEAAKVVAKPSGPQQPKGLKAPRNGKADELRAITGVGPKIEKQLHDLGLYHFDQIVALNKGEIAWVEDHIGFPGRMTREGWQKQCKDLAAGKVTAGAKALKDGKQV